MSERPPLGADEETPARGTDLASFERAFSNRPIIPEPLKSVLERLDAIHETLSSPGGRFASIDARLDSLLCGMRSLASAVMAMEELQGPMVRVSNELDGIAVLIVDDELLVQKGLARVVESCGGVALLARDAGHSLEVLGAARVNVAVIDLRLAPGMGGIKLCQHLRANLPSVGLVIMTGMVTVADEAAARELGIRILEKPAHNRDFIAAIMEANARRAAAAAGHE